MRAVRAVVYDPLGGAHRADQGMGCRGRASTERRDRLAQPLGFRDRVEPGARAIAGGEGHPLGDRPPLEHRPPGQAAKGRPKQPRRRRVRETFDGVTERHGKVVADLAEGPAADGEMADEQMFDIGHDVFKPSESQSSPSWSHRTLTQHRRDVAEG